MPHKVGPRNPSFPSNHRSSKKGEKSTNSTRVEHAPARKVKPLHNRVAPWNSRSKQAWSEKPVAKGRGAKEAPTPEKKPGLFKRLLSIFRKATPKVQAAPPIVKVRSRLVVINTNMTEEPDSMWREVVKANRLEKEREDRERGYR